MARTFRLLLLLAITGLGANAQLVTYEFSGVLKTASSLTLRNAIGVGSTFTATAVFDSSVSASSSTATQATYPLVSLDLTVVGTTLGTWSATSTSSLRNVSVNNEVYFDEIQFSAVVASAATFDTFTADTFNVTFFGGNHLLSSTAVPLTAATYDPAVWDPYQFANQTYLKIYFNSAASNATFQITSVTTPIPEPSTYAAICGGLALAGVMLRRRYARA